MASGRGVGCMEAVGNAVILVRDVAGATHRNAQEALELDWLMRVRTSSLSDAFTFNSSPRKVQPIASPTHKSILSLLACCLPFLAVASSGITCCSEDNSSQLVCRVLRVRCLVGASQTCNALRAHQQGCFYCVFPRRDRHVIINQCYHCDMCSLEQCQALDLRYSRAVFRQLVSYALCFDAFSSVSGSFVW